MADRETDRDMGAAHDAASRPDPAKTASPDPMERGHLRDQIDSGKFRDKVAAPDPATSPLGTDDEAAGVPTPAADVQYESPAAPAHAPANSHSRDTPPSHLGPMIAAGIVVAAFVIGFIMIFSAG
ncbi:hypothetical protein [Skermanella pratensis]|uniref:hypothetical protein n=1 Tax=Skermanella pratensis TaxID=2233999 RepID=UPI0013013F1E|nr:hypothetical protein [Skermanella pratensis]